MWSLLRRLSTLAAAAPASLLTHNVAQRSAPSLTRETLFESTSMTMSSMGVLAVAPAVHAASAESTWRVNLSPEVSTAVMDTLAPGRYDLQSVPTGAAASDAR